jgi:drug/metabolite transporter (DMT)-like permease
MDRQRRRFPTSGTRHQGAAILWAGILNAATSSTPTLRSQLMLAGAMLLWGLNIPAIKILTTSFEPVMLSSLRMFFAWCVFTVIALYHGGRFPKIERAHWGLVTVCGVLMVYANQIFFTAGMGRTTATNTALIVALGPLVSSVLGALVFRERLTGARLLGIALGLIGVGSVIIHRPGAGVEGAGFGDAMIAASVLTFAIGGVLVQRLARKINAISISWSIYTVGTILLALHGCVIGFDAHALFSDAGTFALILFSGVGATAVGNLVWNRSIATLGISRTALFLNWVPLFAIAFAVLFLKEPMSWWLVFGVLCVIAGTWLGSFRVQAETTAALKQ